MRSAIAISRLIVVVRFFLVWGGGGGGGMGQNIFFLFCVIERSNFSGRVVFCVIENIPIFFWQRRSGFKNVTPSRPWCSATDAAARLCTLCLLLVGLTSSW